MFHYISFYLFLYVMTLCFCTVMVVAYYAVRRSGPREISEHDRNLIGHNQKWRCYACKTLMISRFRLTNLQKQTVAVCVNCSDRFDLIDRPQKCLV